MIDNGSCLVEANNEGAIQVWVTAQIELIVGLLLCIPREPCSYLLRNLNSRH